MRLLPSNFSTPWKGTLIHSRTHWLETPWKCQIPGSKGVAHTDWYGLENRCCALVSAQLDIRLWKWFVLNSSGSYQVLLFLCCLWRKNLGDALQWKSCLQTAPTHCPSQQAPPPPTSLLDLPWCLSGLTGMICSWILGSQPSPLQRVPANVGAFKIDLAFWSTTFVCLGTSIRKPCSVTER